MQTHEGYVLLFHLLLLLLVLLRCGSLDAVPRYQGQGLRAYAKLLWKLWKTVEPANIRSFRSMIISIASGIVLMARGVLFSLWVAYSIVYFVCDAVAATLDAVLWVAYVYAVVVWLMITTPIVWAVKMLLSAAFATAVTASWAAYVVLVVLWLLLKPTARTVWSLAVMLLRFSAAVVVVTRFVAVSTTLYLLKSVVRLFVRLYESTASSVCIITSRIARAFVKAKNFLVSVPLAFISHTFELLKTLRVVYWDRAHQATAKSADWSFTCLLLVPAKLGEWSVVRLGMEATYEKTMKQEDQQRAVDASLASETEQHARGVRVETRMVWICEVLPVARPVSTGSWAQYSALLSTTLPVYGPERAPATSPLPKTVPAYIAIVLSPIVASMLKAAHSAFYRDVVHAQGADLCIEAKNHEDHEEVLLIAEDANEKVDTSDEEDEQDGAVAVVELMAELRPEPQPEPPVQVPQLALEPLEPAQAQQQQAPPSRLRAPAVLLPSLRNIQLVPMRPLQFVPAALKPVAVPVEEPIQEALADDNLMADANVNLGEHERDGLDGHVGDLPPNEARHEGRAYREGEQRREVPLREPLVIEHGYDYNRDADARYLEYVESAAYQARRQEALDRIRNRS